MKKVVKLTERDLTRYIPSTLGKSNNELPFEQITVGRGLNEGYTEGGTDKNSYHSYIENFYEKEFEPYKESKIDLLEIGIETGGSLKLWKEYFLNSKSVVGVDISDEKIDQRYKNIDGIIMHFGDAYDEKFSKKFKQFDIIIDDGPHTLESQLKSIKFYLPKLKQNGLFIIEDISDISISYLSIIFLNTAIHVFLYFFIHKCIKILST